MGGCSKDTVERGCLFSWCDLQKGEPQGLEAGRSLSPLWVEYEGATGERALGGHRRGLAVARKEVLEGEAGKTPQVRERFPCRLKTRCCIHQIHYGYTVEVTNRFKGLGMIDTVSEELWVEVHNIVQEVVIKTIPNNDIHLKTSSRIGSKKKLH